MLELIKEHYVLSFILAIASLLVLESCVLGIARALAFRRKSAKRQ